MDTFSDPLRPASIGFGLIRHRRLAPRENAFGYRAYFLRIPVRGLESRKRIGWGIPVNRHGPISFWERDHGARDGTPLAPWIDGVLREAGITDATGDIWLHSFARVLGYVFNPVSFWFCHRTNGELRAIVCEVNNTFGESHLYLLADASGAALSWGQDLQAEKAFHVSPFFDVTGRYRFRFMLARERFVARIDYDGPSGPLLATSISGQLEPVGRQAWCRALLGYPLFTLAVIARIHWQAMKLFAKRVPFFAKPEPPVSKVTR